MASEHDPLTIPVAAQELGITAERIRQLIISGELPAMKRGRQWSIRRADLDSLRRRRMAPGPAKMTSRPTNLQRQVERGALQLPAVRPASVSERAWAVLVRHVRDRVPYTALAAELRVSKYTAEQLAAQAAEALRYPDLADLPGVVRRALVVGGYTTREALAQASDADLLRLKRMTPARLGAVRTVIPHAGEARPAADGSAMTAPVASRASHRTQDAVDTPILEQLAATLANPEQQHEAAGLLRALTRVLLHAVLPLRKENVEPFETGLRYLARQLSAEVRDKELGRDPRYLLGRVDAMLDLCSVAIDHSLSSEVLKQAKRAHGREILHHLVHHGDTTATELANVLGITRSHLSNILRWMEAVGLVRRVEIGRSTLVCLGPKGQGAYDTLAAEQRELAPPPSAAREGVDLGDQPVEVEAPGGSAQAVYQALQELAETRGRTIPDVLREALAMERWLAVRDSRV